MIQHVDVRGSECRDRLRRRQVVEKALCRAVMRCISRYRQPVENGLAFDGHRLPRRRPRTCTLARGVLGGATRVAQVDSIRQYQISKSVRLGDGLVVVDVVEVTRREQRGELRGVRSNVPVRRMLEQRGGEAGALCSTAPRVET